MRFEGILIVYTRLIIFVYSTEYLVKGVRGGADKFTVLESSGWIIAIKCRVSNRPSFHIYTSRKCCSDDENMVKG